jgi:hypothetical protein
MSVETFIVILVVIWIGRELIVGLYIWRGRRRFRNELRVEQAQCQFAIARNKLMSLAVNKEIDVNTRSFKSFYRVNTAFMRRPDQYREIAAMLVHMFLNIHDSSSGEELLAESKNWSPAFREVVRNTADAMETLILNYSLLVRKMFWLEKKLDANSTPSRMLKRIATKAEKEKAIANIRQTRNAMYKMAQGTA